jgi:rubrerythrin
MRGHVSDRGQNGTRAEVPRDGACALMQLCIPIQPFEHHVFQAMKRSFRSLSARQALHVAIFIEERNAEIYHHFGELFAEFRDTGSLEMARVFWDMAAEERNHGNFLLKRYRARYGSRSCPITDEDIHEFIEIPRLHADILLSAGRNPRVPALRQKALEVAHEAEHQALIFYEKMAEVTRDARMRPVYREFADFEGEHFKWIKRKLREAKSSMRAGKISR